MLIDILKRNDVFMFNVKYNIQGVQKNFSDGSSIQKYLFVFNEIILVDVFIVISDVLMIKKFNLINLI